MTVEAAALLLYRPDDAKVLVVKRSMEMATNPGIWGFPAGKVEASEKPIDAAVREFQEEMGSVPFMRVFQAPFVSRPFPDLKLYIFYSAMEPMQMGWEPVLDGEHSEYGWANPRRLPEPVFPAARRAVRRFLTG